MSSESRFPIAPAQDSLDRIPRELRFFPSTNTSPRLLTRQQIDQFNRDGFLTGLRVFEESEIAEHRAYFDRLLAQVMAAGGDSYSISTAHLRYGRVYDLLTNPRIVAFVKDLLGEDVVAWGSHYFCKMPHDGKQVAWHQDATYWPLTPSKAVTVWLAIDDADTQNACMRFVAGSHHHGHLAHHATTGEGEPSVLDRAIDQVEQYGDIVDVELGAGEVSIHTDLLLHGSAANNSDRRRCGLTLRYCPAEVRAAMDWNLKGVIVSGNDRSGHWANPPRPPSD
jgi:ectoine hydroxylase-related dioxygenase (phytanoyl-CoA dioxygenase family)